MKGTYTELYLLELYCFIKKTFELSSKIGLKVHLYLLAFELLLVCFQSMARDTLPKVQYIYTSRPFSIHISMIYLIDFNLKEYWHRHICEYEEGIVLDQFPFDYHTCYTTRIICFKTIEYVILQYRVQIKHNQKPQKDII